MCFATIGNTYVIKRSWTQMVQQWRWGNGCWWYSEVIIIIIPHLLPKSYAMHFHNTKIINPNTYKYFYCIRKQSNQINAKNSNRYCSILVRNCCSLFRRIKFAFHFKQLDDMSVCACLCVNWWTQTVCWRTWWTWSTFFAEFQHWIMYKYIL